MQIIRNKFILKAKEITTDAIGAYVVFQLGINSHAEFASLNPHAPLSVYSGLAGTVNGRTCKYAPTHTQVQVKI